ncbi:MAG: DUF7064 domain-containing protein [Candidatus Helarchaeota archaeon]
MTRSKKSRRMFKISEKDEFKHAWRRYPEHHNESWYFNCIDFDANVFIVTRVGYLMGKGEMEVLFLLVVDRENDERNVEYFNPVKVDGFLQEDIYGDENVRFECLEPMKKWKINFNHEMFEVDLEFKERFPPYIYMSQEDPMEVLKKYGMEILKVAAQKHYEQGMSVTGIIKFKDKGQIKEERQINCYGHRDHSWGTRDWVLIDKWNWMSCQFDEYTINSTRVEVFGKVIEKGFISSTEGAEPIISVEVDTEHGFEGKESIPKSSIFRLATPTRQFEIVSKTWKSLYIQRPSERGLTEIHEQIVKFEMDGKSGYGISEYMSSTPKE